jgi:signal peptidase I
LSSDINVNRDHLGPIYVPKKGDVFSIHEETNWKYLLPLLLMEGNTATLQNNGKSYHFTLQDPNEIFRRKGKEAVFDEYFSEYNQNGKLITPWNPAFKNAHFKYLMINGEPASLMNEYKLKQNYYWAMGDNRDDSLDSRYWGFVPENFILGEALFTYFSLNLNTWIPRWDRIGTVLK